MDVAPQDFITQAAEVFPNKPAVIFKDQTLTYLELNSQIEKTYEIFKNVGIKKGSVVAVLSENSLEFWVSFFALLKCQAVSFPVSPSLSLPEIQGLIGAVKPDFLFFNRQKINIEENFFAGVAGQVFSFNFDKELTVNLISKEKGFTSPLYNESSDNLMIMTSSGTTGRPKMMFLDEEYLYNMTFAALEGMRTDEDHISLSLAPPQHFIGIVLPLSAWRQQTTVVLIDEFVPDYVLKTIEKHRVVLTVATPFVLSILADVFNDNFDVSSLKKCISGGSPLDRRVYDKVTSKMKVPLHQGYGSIEAGLVATRLDSEEFEENFGGTPARLIDVKIFDDQGQELASGQTGNVAVAGPTVVKGYIGGEKVNEKFFIDKYFLVGDRGYLSEDGKLYVVGRNDDVINIAGKKVDPVEVENVLTSHPEVKESLVFGHNSLSTQIVKSLVVVASGSAVTPEILYKYCSQYLSSYKIPKDFEFVDALPRDRMGKVVRKNLVK